MTKHGRQWVSLEAGMNMTAIGRERPSWTQGMVSASTSLVSVCNLSVRFPTLEGDVTAVDDISFDIAKGEILGLVGESGSGKSVTGRSLMKLNPKHARYDPASRIRLTVAGRSIDVLSLDRDRDLLPVRGGDVSMVFQEPSVSLAPAIPIGSQMVEQLRLHTRISAAEAKELALHMLERVRIPDPAMSFAQYAFELSGGMLQRVMIAMALSTRPSLLIADEPTTALDVTIQAQIIDLIEDVVAEFGMSVLLITHDLSVVARMTDRVAVMYLGRLVEIGDTRDVIRAPQHPYSKGLIRAHPRIDTVGQPLTSIPGDIPSIHERPTGCPFHPRCSVAVRGLCDITAPVVVTHAGNHQAACHLVDSGSGF